MDIISIEDQQRVFKNEKDIECLLQPGVKDIIEINISNNTFYPEALSAFFIKIDVDNVRVLKIRNIFAGLSTEETFELLVIISEHVVPEKIEYLDISGNALSKRLPERFNKFIRRLSGLSTFRVNNCGLGILGGKLLAEALQNIENKTNLKDIDIGENKLAESGADISAAVGLFKNLEKLRLAANNIGVNEMVSVFKNIEWTRIQWLDVSDNFMDERCGKMGGMICSKFRLEFLDLSYCLLRNEGLRAFLDNFNVVQHSDIDKNGKLLHIDLSGNDLNDEIVGDIINLLKTCDIELTVIDNELTKPSLLMSHISGKSRITTDDDIQMEPLDEIIDRIKDI